MLKEDYPITPAVRFLREKKIAFIPFLYRYEEHGGTHQFAAKFNVPDHQVIKTLVFETDQKKPLLVLMHGDREVSTKQIARIIGAKQVTPCDASTAQRIPAISLAELVRLEHVTNCLCMRKRLYWNYKKFISMEENAVSLSRFLRRIFMQH